MKARTLIVLSLICAAPLVSAQPNQAQNTTPSAEPAPANTPADPLSFYRKNPELMKRYFPHLAAGQETQLPPGRYNLPPSAKDKVIPFVRFPGGSAEELANTLRKIIDPPPNILIPENLKGADVPPFELQNVKLADVFQALNSLTENKEANWQLSGSNEPIWVLNPLNKTDGFGMPFPQQVDPLTGMPLVNGVARNCQIFPVGRFLAKYNVEDITTAVKTAWEMMGNEKNASMKYHKDTDLLIVVGTPGQLAILNDILKSLEEQMKQETPSRESKGSALKPPL